MARPTSQPRASSDSLQTVMTSSSIETIPTLQPAAATSTLFLFAQSRSVVCVQHNTLALERRFERHSADVKLIAVDNISETGHGRVVSIDASKEAIVWDSSDGEELARFSPFEEIRVAAWMRNGNFSCGDCKGNVILFDPTQSESILAHTIADPLTALAPSADCKTFALGYQNGSILVASLVPFTILHTLTTSSLSPSPIASLAWHASSAKQKSDMLATQTKDGDLRVWSVAKAIEGGEPARVVRVLNTPEGNRKGRNWCAWSMKGRVVQFSEGETTVWDVRQKKVLWEKVDTPENLTGLAVCSPKGMLFTIEKEYTVQQFGLYPPTLLNTVQHTPPVSPPSPLTPIDKGKVAPAEQQSTTPERRIERFIPPDDDYRLATMSPLGRIAHELELLEKMEAEGLGISNLPTQRTVSVSSRPSQSRHQSNASVASNRSGRSISEHNEQIVNSSIPKSRQNSVGGAQPSPSRKPHPLAQEIHPSPIDPKPNDIALDLFANLRSRLPSVTYQSPRIPSSAGKLTADDLRKEMLFCIFGWRGDVDTLIRDELDSVDSKSLNAVMLRLWLGDLDQNSLAVMLGSNLTVSADWLFLGLSAMDGKKAWDCVARAFVMRLLQRSDVHMAVILLLALGDGKDAVEVYVSNKHYMEAVILASYLWKTDWKKISQLVRKWGEHASANGESALAARCFACAGTEAPEDIPPPPAAAGMQKHSRSGSNSESVSTFVRGLPISPPSNPRATLRMTPKESPLKLITSFQSPDKPLVNDKAVTNSPAEMVSSLATRFFGWGDKNNMKSPHSAISTPIAMSALSPTEPYWQGHRNFPASKGSQSKLPVVTETPSEETPKEEKPPVGELKPSTESMEITSPVIARNTNGFSGSKTITTLGERMSSPPLRSTTPKTVAEQISHAPTPKVKAESISHGTTPKTVPVSEGGSQINSSRNGTPSGTPVMLNSEFPAVAALTGGKSPLSSAAEGFTKEHTRTSSVRKPAGLVIQWPGMDGILNGDSELPPPTIKHSRTGSRNTPPITRNINHRKRDEDDYLSGIDELEEHHGRSRGSRLESPDRRRRNPSRSRIESPERRGRSQNRRPGGRDPSERRGRSILRAKATHMRSPSSPLPFSPQAALYKDEDDCEDERYYTRNTSRARARPSSRDRERRRDREIERGRNKGRIAGIQGSHMRSPSSPALMSSQMRYYKDDDEEQEEEYEDERYYTRARSTQRGRSITRVVNTDRSPSSPLPFSPEADLYRDDSEEEYRRSRSKQRQRDDSRTRGPQVPRHELRRSRSERTLSAWARSMERSMSIDRRPPVPDVPLGRAMSIRAPGLPATPKAWKALSRTQSPAPPTPLRGRSPAPGPLPLIGQDRRERSPAPGILPLIATPLTTPASGNTLSSSPRFIAGSARTMSPSPQIANGRARSTSRVGEQPMMGLPSAPGIMKGVGSYHDTDDATAAAFAKGERIPEMTPNSEMNRSITTGHARKASISKPSPLNRTFYPTPKVQAPLGSPPPLPVDLPVHPALQMDIPPSNGVSRKISISKSPPLSSSIHSRGPSLTMRMGNRSVDLKGESTVMGIDEVIASRATPSPQHMMSGFGGSSNSGLMISIGMTENALLEEERSGRMSPAILPPGDPRLGTPI